MNAETLVHGEMLTTSIIKPSGRGGWIFWFPQRSVIFPCLSFPQRYRWSLEILTFIRWITYKRGKFGDYLRISSPGIYLFSSVVGRLFVHLNSYQVSTRNGTLLWRQIRRLR